MKKVVLIATLLLSVCSQGIMAHAAPSPDGGGVSGGGVLPPRA